MVDRDSSRRVKRRRPGRANKYLGDLALMSASPLDAREYYVRAMEACRDGDKLWYGVFPDAQLRCINHA